MSEKIESPSVPEPAKIEPVTQKTMTDRVEANLMDYLKRSDLSPGDPVPKETELAASLGVSRNVVREALSRLRMLGVVNSRKRRGMVVGHPDLFSGFRRLLDPDMLEIGTVKEIFELRLVIEVGLADLIYLRITPDDLAELQQLVETNEKILSDEKRIVAEVQFHKRLYRIAGNDTLRQFQTMLLPLFKFVAELEAGEGAPTRPEISHQDLVDVLRRGTVDEFRAAMRTHLAPHFDRLRQWKP